MVNLGWFENDQLPVRRT